MSETYDEMMARSAAMDHELWPETLEWNHSHTCIPCSAYRWAQLEADYRQTGIMSEAMRNFVCVNGRRAVSPDSQT